MKTKYVSVRRSNEFSFPSWVTFCEVEVLNTGIGSFDGLLLLRYSNTKSDIKKSNFPLHSEIQDVRLQPGDSTIFKLSFSPLPAGTEFRFMIKTDVYAGRISDPIDPYFYFGLDRFPELSYENNTADYVVY
jgi:hypothetical protein